MGEEEEEKAFVPFGFGEGGIGKWMAVLTFHHLVLVSPLTCCLS